MSAPRGRPNERQMQEARFHLNAARDAVNAIHSDGFKQGGYLNEWMSWVVRLRDQVDDASIQLRLIDVLGGES